MNKYRRNMLSLMASISMVMLCTAGLSSCSSVKRIVGLGDDYKSVYLTYDVDANVNINKSGQSVPIAVVSYQLHKADTFSSSNFSKLYSKPQQTLGANLINVEYSVLPAMTKKRLRFKVPPNVNFIGFVVAYYNMSQKTWRYLLPLDKSKTKVELQLTRHGINRVS